MTSGWDYEDNENEKKDDGDRSSDHGDVENDWDKHNDRSQIIETNSRGPRKQYDSDSK